MQLKIESTRVHKHALYWLGVSTYVFFLHFCFFFLLVGTAAATCWVPADSAYLNSMELHGWTGRTRGKLRSKLKGYQSCP